MCLVCFVEKNGMPRIAGVNIPEKKRIEISLTYVYGIGRFSSNQVLKQTGIDPNTKAGQLSPEDLNKLREVVGKRFKIEGDLKRERMLNIKRLKDIKSYRGSRHTKGLPVRGQRTKTNTRTVRGNVRRTAGSGRKSASEKT